MKRIFKNNLVIVRKKNKTQYDRPSPSLPSMFTAIFTGEPGLAGFIGAKDDGRDGDSWSYKTCESPVKSSPPTNQHPTFLQAGCPSGRPTNSVVTVLVTLIAVC